MWATSLGDKNINQLHLPSYGRDMVDVVEVRSEIHILITPHTGLSTLGAHIHPILGNMGGPIRPSSEGIYSTSNGGKNRT